MILMCNALAALSPEHLRLCISTLGEFGRQSDTNISLTAAESFLRGVSNARSSFAEKLRCIERAGNRRPMVFYPKYPYQLRLDSRDYLSFWAVEMLFSCALYDINLRYYFAVCWVSIQSCVYIDSCNI